MRKFLPTSKETTKNIENQSILSNISKIIYILEMSQYISNTHERPIYTLLFIHYQQNNEWWMPLILFRFVMDTGTNLSCLLKYADPPLHPRSSQQVLCHYYCFLHRRNIQNIKYKKAIIFQPQDNFNVASQPYWSKEHTFYENLIHKVFQYWF